MSSKNIIITGTSRGIGYELVQVFAQGGHKVLALSRNERPIKALGLDGVTALSCDISSEDDLAQAKNKIEQMGSVDILIHNAGALVNKPFEKLTKEDFKKVYEVNVYGVARLTQLVLPHMHTGGHVVGINSMGGVQGTVKFPGLAAYSSSKGALTILFELLAEEYKESQISFNTLALGAVRTEMLEEAFPGYEAPLTASEMAAYIYGFALTGNKFYNGKTLQVSASTP
ncbi:MAG: short-chain dehydrogenase [Cytophagaceae bacterium]|nr:short-chain dehydrogenase [Cytophagaceae bacterium]|tara:strand:- start:3017 stop:3700 length:684 start_codon:yes stop_codon:yes gene_type:complete